MALKFKKVQRKIMFGADKDKVKTYAMAKASGYCDMAKLCELISNRSAMSSADVKAILDSLNWAMGLELRSGNIVQVGEFGNFRLSVKSTGTDSADDFNASKIKKARIVFTPGSSLRWSNEITKFEEESEKKEDKPNTGGGDDDDRPVIE
nr:HU family DNA-binding protein [Parabacteroides goldsteinii]